MNLKNYTTGVSAERSIAEIEKLLAAFGASAVMKEFSGDGKVKSLAFKYQNNGYRLPVNEDGVYQVMFSEKRPSHGRNAMRNREEQAYRVAWRLLKDWIHAQMSIVASGQAKPDEVLLPYLFDGRKTLYEAYSQGLLKIGPGKEDLDNVPKRQDA